MALLPIISGTTRGHRYGLYAADSVDPWPCYRCRASSRHGHYIEIRTVTKRGRTESLIGRYLCDDCSAAFIEWAQGA